MEEDFFPVFFLQIGHYSNHGGFTFMIMSEPTYVSRTLPLITQLWRLRFKCINLGERNQNTQSLVLLFPSSFKSQLLFHLNDFLHSWAKLNCWLIWGFLACDYTFKMASIIMILQISALESVSQRIETISDYVLFTLVNSMPVLCSDI